MDGAHVCFIDLPNKTDNHLKGFSKSAKTPSPLTPSPRLERNIGFFHALTRRFGRRSHDDIIVYRCEDDSRSSSTDSCSSTNCNLDIHNHRINKAQIKNGANITSQSNFELSCNSSDTSSNADIDLNNDKTSSSRNRITRRSTSSIRRALENFSISTRSLSCSNASSKENLPTKTQKIKEPKKQPKPQQRILRRPIQYTYIKGISGLPTQRVPRSTCCNYARR